MFLLYRCRKRLPPGSQLPRIVAAVGFMNAVSFVHPTAVNVRLHMPTITSLLQHYNKLIQTSCRSTSMDVGTKGRRTTWYAPQSLQNCMLPVLATPVDSMGRSQLQTYDDTIVINHINSISVQNGFVKTASSFF